MAAFISGYIAGVSVKCLDFIEHSAMVHPYLFVLFFYLVCPVLMIGIILVCVTAIMVPVSWIMGWL